MTIVEVVVSCVLIAGIVAFTLTSVVAVTNVSQRDEARNREQNSHRYVMAQLRAELQDCTTDPDPITNQNRWQIGADADGRPTLRVQKLVGAQLAGTELAAMWSDWVTFAVDQKGIVSRTEGGKSRTLGSGIKELRYAVTPTGMFEVTCVTRRRDPATGKIVEQTYREWITPRL